MPALPALGAAEPPPVPRFEIERYLHRRFTAADGLPSTAPYKLAQTPDGYLWIGTSDGLVRFDGRRFDLFDRSNTAALKVNEVWDLATDVSGTLWIGMRRGGLASLRAGHFRFHGPDDGRSVISFARERSGALLATTGTDVVRVSADGKLERIARLPASRPEEEIASISPAPDGTIWIGMYPGVVYAVRGGQVSRRPLRPLAAQSMLWFGPRDEVWASTLDGIGPLTDAGQRIALRTRGTVFASLLDLAGNLWLGTSSGVIHLSAAGEETSLRDSDRDFQGRHGSLLQDRDASIWFASYGGALHQLVETPLSVLGPSRGLGTIVRSLLVARDGALWAAAEEGVFRRSGGRVSRIPRPPRLVGGERISSLAETPDGTIWVGTWNGLYTVRGSGLAEVPELATAFVFALHCDRKGRLWVGAGGGHGVGILEGGRLRFLEGLRGVNTFFIHEDPAGRIWLGTNKGLWEVVDDRTAVRRDLGGHPERELVFAIADRAAGGLWVGMMESGLTTYPSPSRRLLGTQHGLPSDSVDTLVEAEGSLWVGAGRQIARVPLADLEAVLDGRSQRLRPELLGSDDGLRTSTVLCGGGPTVARGKDGLIYLPGSEGVITLDPRWKPTGPPAPTTHVRSARLDGAAAPLETLSRIEPGLHRLEISYTGIWLRAPAKVRYRYRLTGLDTGWVDAGDRHTADLTNLPPGRFLFEVQSTADGLRYSPSATLPIVVAPFPWQRAWFFPALAALVVAAAAFAYRARVSRMQAEERDLASLVDFGRSLAGVLDPDEIITCLARSLRERLAAARLLVAGEREGRPPLVAAPDPELLAAGLPPVAEAKGLRKPLRLEGRQDAPGSLLGELKARGVSLVVPLVSGETSFGYVALGAPEGRRRWTDKEVEQAAGLVAQAALALEGAWQAQEAVRWQHVSEARREWLELDLLSRLAFAAVARQGSEGLVSEESVLALLAATLSSTDTSPARFSGAIARLLEEGILVRPQGGGLGVGKSRWLLLPELRQPLAEIARQGATRIGAYRIVERIGVGGMGEVFRGVNVHDGSLAAVKLLFPYQTGDAEARHRLEREGKLVARLQHPSIVRLLERGEHDGRLYLAMELLKGETLASRIQREGPLPRKEAFVALGQIASALALLHEAGVVHRDVKSANIMRVAADHYVLLDFGLARGLESSTVTQAQAVLGTLPYMSPEQLRGEEAGPASDLWSLGVVFHELLAGRLPWAGNATVRMALAILGEDRTIERERLGRDVDALLDALLQRDPAKRPRDGRALVEILAQG